MGIDKDRIFALIAQRPQIRTVEIADIVDCEPEYIEPGLAPEIAAGHIIVHQVVAPNGRPANGFEFSERFKETGAYRAIAAAAGISQAAAPVMAQAPAKPEPDARAPANAPSARPDLAAPAPKSNKRPREGAGIQWRDGRAESAHTQDAARMTHPERAIEFIRGAGGRADNESLRDALGFGAGASPASYLRAALVDGRLIRDGRDWMLGPQVDAPPRYLPGVVKARALSAPATPEQQPQGVFRCGMWSDGMLELQRDGRTIAALAPNEQAAIYAILAPRA